MSIDEEAISSAIILALTTLLSAMRLRYARVRPPSQMGVREIRALCTSSSHHLVLVIPSELMRITDLTRAVGHWCLMHCSPKRFPSASRSLPDQYCCVRDPWRVLMTRQEKHISRI